MPTGIAAGVVAAAMLLGGCQPADDVSTPPPSISPSLPTTQTGSPTVSSTPTPSPSLVVTARPTTPEETAALVAEAEWVYREITRIMDEYDWKNSTKPLPELLKDYVGGTYGEAITSVYSGDEAFTYTAEGYTRVHRGAIFTDIDDGALIGIDFCNDPSSVVFRLTNGTTSSPTQLAVDRAQFSRGADGKLRMTNNSAFLVSSCTAPASTWSFPSP